MGGGDTQVYQPTPPPAPTTQESIDAYIEGLPAMYGAQMEYGPQIAQQQFQQQQDFLPQYTALQQGLQQQYAPQQAQQAWEMQQQYAPQYAQQQQDIQREFEPEAYAARESLGGLTGQDYMTSAPMLQAQSSALSGLEGASQAGYGGYNSQTMGQLESMITPEYLTGYRAQEAPGLQAAKQRLTQDVRSSQAARGLGQSGFGAQEEQERLAELEFPYAMGLEQMTLGEQARRQGQAQDVGAFGAGIEQMRLGEIGRQQQVGLGVGQLQQQAGESAISRYMSEIGRRQNLGLSMAGRFNVPTQPQIGTPGIGLPNVQSPNLMAGYNFGQVQNAMGQGYGNFASASRPIATQPSDNIWSMLGGVGGGLATGAGYNLFK